MWIHYNESVVWQQFEINYKLRLHWQKQPNKQTNKQTNNLSVKRESLEVWPMRWCKYIFIFVLLEVLRYTVSQCYDKWVWPLIYITDELENMVWTLSVLLTCANQQTNFKVAMNGYNYYKLYLPIQRFWNNKKWFNWFRAKLRDMFAHAINKICAKYR